MVTVKCLECKKDFEAQRSSAKFCSTKCRVDYNRRSEEQETEVQPTGIIELKKEPELVVKEELINAFNAPVELPKPQKVVLPKAKGIMMGADYLAELPKTMFQKLLIEFNGLVEDLPPISKIEANLMGLIEKSQHPELTARQSEAIRERCINYLTGQYAGQKQKN